MQLLLWFFLFLRLNLFQNLCNHPLLAVKGLVSSSVLSFFWKPSYRLKASCRNTLPSTGTLFLFISSTQKFKAFSSIINSLSCTIAVTFAVCGTTEKVAQIFSLFITSRMEDSFLPCNLAISEYDFFYFNHIQNFHFLTHGKDITTFLRLTSTTSITTLTLWVIVR